MSCHPCCGNPLQSWTKGVAVFQIVRSALTLVRGIILLSTGAGIGDDLLNVNTTTVKGEGHGNDKDPMGFNTSFYHFETTTTTTTTTTLTIGAYVVLGACIFSILEGIVTLILSAVLYNGASNRISRKCRTWLIGQYILIVPGISFFCAGLYGMAPRDAYHNSYITAIGLGIDAYCIWLVHEFIQELRAQPQGSRGLGVVHGKGQGVLVQRQPIG